MARPFKRNRDGSIGVKLRQNEREMLESLPLQLTELLSSDDPSLRRLFPAAYNLDATREAEYRRLMHEDLLARHLAAAHVLASTAHAASLAPAEVDAWLSSINALRLVLGTQLDVSEDVDTLTLAESLHPDDPRVVQVHVYGWLGYLMESLIQADDPDVDDTPRFPPPVGDVDDLDPDDLDPDDLGADPLAPTAADLAALASFHDLGDLRNLEGFGRTDTD